MGPRNPSRHRWLVPFRSCCHLMAYRTSRVWYPARVLATHVGLAYHHKKRTKSTQKHRKNRPGLLLRRLLSFHCHFTDQRCLEIWFYNDLFFGKRSWLLLYGVAGLYLRRALSSSLYGMERGTPVKFTCCSRVRQSFDYGVCVADCYRGLDLG